MIFTEALAQLINGKKVARPAWNTYYIMLVSGQSYIWMIGNTNQKQDPNVIAYTPSLDDLNAADWVIKF